MILVGTDRLTISGHISGASATTVFHLQVDEISPNPGTNHSTARVYLVCTTATVDYANTSQTLHAVVNGTSIDVDAKITVGTGGWTQGPWDIDVAHDADGSKSISLSLDSTGISWFVESGSGTVSTSLTLTKLVAAPGTPTGVSATRVSDTSCTVAFTPVYATNAVPTSTKIYASVDGGAEAVVVSAGNSSSLPAPTLANHKYLFRVTQGNSAGTSAESAPSTAYFTTPAAPTSVAATKDPSLDIVVSWTPQVAFSEHVHVVEHGTITGGVTTWDGSPLASVAAGTSSYTHSSPNPAQVHVYRVSAKNTDTGALQSSTELSNSVQLLAAPNKPTLPTLPTCVDKANAFVVTWTHNAVDTTPQKYYEFGYSTNGGTTWSSTGKVTSATSSKSIAGSTYTAGTTLTIRVRTWGQATTGGSDGTGASPWSDTQAVTFKTRPVATISSPANSSTWTQAALAVALGFSQAESATFVQASIELSQSGTPIETISSTTLASTALSTRVLDGDTYTLTVTVTDSNGLVSDPVTSTFSVDYTNPVTAGVTVTYLPDSGIAQLDLTIASPGVGEVAATTLSIERTINGVTESIVDQYPITGSPITILDTTPVIHGTNTYTVATFSVDGASAVATEDLTTTEMAMAFLSTGPGFATIVNFIGDLQFAAAPARSLSLVATAGRARPIALFGENGSLVASGTASLVDGLGSTAQELEAFILEAGTVCYRDPSGRRIFGALTGSLASPSKQVSTLQYKVSEAS